MNHDVLKNDRGRRAWRGCHNLRHGGEEFRDRKPSRTLRDIKHIIVIYQENWSFDSLYGQFPAPMATLMVSTRFHSSTNPIRRILR